jgi:hypothetical protein
MISSYVETAHAHGIVSGYTCGSGCLEFRPGGNATRGQISKIVYPHQWFFLHP